MKARPTDPLNDRQTEVLKWIGAGCPDRPWPDYSHRISARSLTTRGLVTIRGHGPSWTAALTDAGRVYLEHGPQPDEPTNAGPAPAPELDPATGLPITAQNIAEALANNGGRHSVHDPAPRVRAAYRRAIAAIKAQALLPAGHRITHSGRDHGDLVIRLTDTSQPQADTRTVPVPSEIDQGHFVVKALTRRVKGLEIGEASRERALLLHQAIALEAERRGYSCTVPDEGPSLVVTIEGVDAPFRIYEEQERVRAVSQDEAQKVKYEWQRAPIRATARWSGRLVLTLQTSKWGSPWWADRKRWTLDSRLGQALEAAEEWCSGERQRLDEAEAAKQTRRKKWEEAVPSARRAHADAVNRDRADAQVAAFSRAADLRVFADAVEARLPPVDDDKRDPSANWVAWLRGEAERVDPLLHPDVLRYQQPDKPSVTDLDKYMPPGMTSALPPT